MIIIRWADDFIIGFEHQQDAQRFLVGLRERLAKPGLEWFKVLRRRSQKTRVT